MSQQPADLVSIDAIKLVHLPSYNDISGNLIVMEGMIDVPFNISRAFTIIAPSGALRGQHAHRACSQFLTCPSGSIEVLCDDGDQVRTWLLDRPDIGLYLPASIWIQERYLTDHAVLNVLCDLPYDDSEYIRDYHDFKNYRAERRSPDNK